MLMEGMHAKSTKGSDKGETVKVVSFLTLNTVEGIVGGTDPAELAE